LKNSPIMFSASSLLFQDNSALPISAATLQQRSSADSTTLPSSSFKRYLIRRISRALSGHVLFTIGRLKRVTMGDLSLLFFLCLSLFAPTFLRGGKLTQSLYTQPTIYTTIPPSSRLYHNI